MTKVQQGTFGALLVMCIWAGWLVVSRWGVTHSLTNIDILFLRFVTPSAIVMLFIPFIGFKAFFNKYTKRTLIAGFASGIPYVWFSFIGLEASETANAGVIVNGSLPIFTILIMYGFTHLAPNFIQIIGIMFIIIANIALIASDKMIGLGSYSALLAAGLSLSIYASTVKFWSIKAEDIIVVAPTINFILILPIWLLSPSNIPTAPLYETLTQMAYQGIVVSLIALWSMSFALKHISAYSFAMIMAMVPFIAALLAHFILGEALTLNTLIAAIFCTLGVIVFNARGFLQRFRKKKV